MKLSLAVVSLCMISITSFASVGGAGKIELGGFDDNQPRLSETCEAAIYAKVDKALPRSQYVTKIRQNADVVDQADLEITLKMAKENLCIKTGAVLYQKTDEGLCQVIQVKIDPRKFDCG